MRASRQEPEPGPGQPVEGRANHGARQAHRGCADGKITWRLGCTLRSSRPPQGGDCSKESKRRTTESRRAFRRAARTRKKSRKVGKPREVVSEDRELVTSG